MAERLKRAAAWLGLVTDDRYAEYDDAVDFEDLTQDDGQDDSLNTADKSATVTPLESRRTASGAAAAGTTLASHPRTADVSRITTVHPRTYNEARIVGEHFRDGVPVIMNLTDMEDVDAKRLVDFAAGLIFGLRGSIERVTSKVFLLSPHDVTVAAEDKERIAGGFFNQS